MAGGTVKGLLKEVEDGIRVHDKAQELIFSCPNCNNYVDAKLVVFSSPYGLRKTCTVVCRTDKCVNQTIKK